MLASNIVLDKFHEGGPIMYPILVVMIATVAIVLERIFWWTTQSAKRESAKLDKIYDALQNEDVAGAAALSKNSSDPRIRMIWHGLHHYHASLEGALQVAAGIEIQKAGRFIMAMDTIITLAPLLGLLGTVTGIMGTFAQLGNSELSEGAVTGGIGEALIATACGLGVAIFTLIPYNIFSAAVAKLQFELETAASNVEVMADVIRRAEDKQLQP